MISFDYLALKAFFEENKDFFIGARLQKIQQPTRRDLLLTIRGFETRKLYINIDPQIYHICFLSEETAKKRNITIPLKPPMFCMLLRKHLEGFRIKGVNVPKYERIFEIYFESYNELNEQIELCLAIELMGKYSNVILYNRETGLIIGCAHNVGSEKSKERELSGTLPYVYPPKQEKVDILAFNGSVDYDSLNSSFMGFSKALENQLKRNLVPLTKIKDYMALLSAINPAVNEKEFSIYSELIEGANYFNTVNEMIDSYFSTQQEKIIRRALKLKLKNIVYPQYVKQSNLKEKLFAQLKKKDKAAKYKKYADLIVANLYNNEDFTDSIEVTDWETNETIIIPLNKELTLKENSQKYYQMYSKSKNAVEKLLNLREEAEKEENYLNGILCSINTAESIVDLLEIESECEDIGLIKKNTDKKQNTAPNVSETEIYGFKVYIGKNNKQNDYIISKLSSSEDIWFHTQNTPGSHVLLKIRDNKIPDEEVIYQCCKLAKAYSSASENTKSGVIYTKRKYIKKPPKAPLGSVIYKNEKEIVVE